MLDTIEANGRRYTVEIMADDAQDPPWESECGHVEVFERHASVGGDTIRKAPSERILYRDRFRAWVYDHADAVALARRDGWARDTVDAEACRVGVITEGERAERAVYADADRMRRWLAGDWGYVGVVVRRESDCQCCGENASLWGIESDDTEYLREVALELVDELEG